MVNIVNSYHAVVIFFIIVKTVYSDLSEGSLCVFESSGRPGVCKLLTHCRKVRDNLIKNHELPQTCGFQETQPIVCCPRNGSEKIMPGEISKIMCRRYSRYLFGNETSNITKNECGHTIVKRAVGDVPASDKQFPHLAQIGTEDQNGEITWYLGGAIVSELYVLTAASWVSPYYGRVKFVRIGLTSDPTSGTEYRQGIKIAATIVHPDFKSEQMDYNDIALIKLEKPAKFNAFARPACLYTKPEILEEKAIATGRILSISSNVQLLKVVVHIVEFESCNATYKQSVWRRRGLLKESHICAGGVADTCQSYGYPLQIHHTGDDIMCMYDIVGISSFGNSCETRNPGVYTKVSHYIQWIENTVWPSEL